MYKLNRIYENTKIILFKFYMGHYSIPLHTLIISSSHTFFSLQQYKKYCIVEEKKRSLNEKSSNQIIIDTEKKI